MKTFAVLLILFSLCAADDVLVGTEGNLNGILQENDLVLIDFYAPWCNYCKKLAPQFATAAADLRGKAVFVKVDATAETGLSEEYKIESYPTLKLFRNGQQVEYEGGRNAKSITAFMKKQVGPAARELTSKAELEAFLPQKEADPPVVIFFGDGSASSRAHQFFWSFAGKKRNDFNFGAVSNMAIAATEKEGTIVLFKPYDEKRVVYDGDERDPSLLKWIRLNFLKMVGEIGSDNYRQYVERGLPIVWLFTTPDKTAVESHNALVNFKQLGPEFRNDLSLVYLNGDQFKQMAQKLSLSGNKFPALATEDSLGEHYAFDEKAELTEDAMRQWLKKFLGGQLRSTIRSEEKPSGYYDDKGVRVVVGNTFKDIVYDTSSDVLIEFYAPWCAHCKEIIPVYAEVASLYKGKPGVVVAKIDATANDPPTEFKVSGFPTIKLVTAVDNEVVDYDGPRTRQSFIDFIKKHGKGDKSAHDEL